MEPTPAPHPSPKQDYVRDATLGEKVGILAAVLIPFGATIYAVTLFWGRGVGWPEVALFFGMWLLTSLGISIGYHRMLTHRSFDAPGWVRGLFLVLGSMSLQGPAIEWAATHVKHHAKSDQEGDPHSPLEGFFHAHLGWLFRDRLVREGVWAKPFRDDPVAVFVDRTFWAWTILSLAIPFAVGGLVGLALGHGFWWPAWAGLVWGGGVRIFVSHHVTWSVNSVCHTFGRRMFHTRDQSRNNWVIALFSNGEGWHNNHHAFPKAAYHGMRWWQVDVSAYLIRGMARLGLARNVWMPTEADMEARRVRKARKAPRRAPVGSDAKRA